VVFDEYHARIVDSTHHAVYGEPHPSARTLRTSNRLPRSPARANVEDVGREILARKLVSAEYRLHKNFNLSAGRLWDLQVTQQ
jgi:hypothetical protein